MHATDRAEINWVNNGIH